MTCATYRGDDFCPTADQLIPQYLAMLPRGRAWGEGGPGRMPGGIIYGCLYALALVMASVHAAICAMVPEFYCSSAEVTLDWWREQYAVDDGCDPFPDLCAKVAAFGGVTCAYFQAVAALNGWHVLCGVKAPSPSPFVATVGCGYVGGAGSILGYAGASEASPGGLHFTVLVPAPTIATPAPPAVAIPQPFAGALLAGQALNCAPGITSPAISTPDITGLRCLMARVVPAHARVTYDFGVLTP